MRRFPEYRPSDWYWIVADDEAQLWSSARAAYVPSDDAELEAWLAGGRRPTRIASEGDLGAVLAEAYPEGMGSLGRRKVAKDLVEQRLAAVGKLDACMAIIMGNAAFFSRWYARAFPWVYADDPDTVAVITAVGADPDAILAA